MGVAPFLSAAATVACVLVAPAIARAENRFSISYMGYGGDGVASRLRVTASDDAVPDALRGRSMFIDGTARTVGGGVRAVLEIDDVRLGGSDFFYGVDGLRFLHDPTPQGISLRAADGFGMHGELFVGRRFGKKDIYAYIDACAALTFVGVSVRMKSDAIGFTGGTPYDRALFSFGPRVGAIVPLGSIFFIDASAQYRLMGFERLGLSAGIGLWFTGTPLE